MVDARATGAAAEFSLRKLLKHSASCDLRTVFLETLRRTRKGRLFFEARSDMRRNAKKGDPNGSPFRAALVLL